MKRSSYEVLISDEDEEDRLDERLHVDSIAYVRERKRIAADVDRRQRPAKKQAVETRAESIEFSDEMLQHLAKQREDAIQRRLKKTAKDSRELQGECQRAVEKC